jgi:hypothetical protein
LRRAWPNVDGLHLVIGGPPLPGSTVDPLTGTGPSMLLTGTVQRSGERIRVNPRLAAVRNDSTLWSGRFDGKASDLLTLEDEIAFGTISAIKKQISMPK